MKQEIIKRKADGTVVAMQISNPGTRKKSIEQQSRQTRDIVALLKLTNLKQSVIASLYGLTDSRISNINKRFNCRPIRKTTFKRSKQIDCQIEPAYLNHRTVLMSFRDPDWVAHDRSKRCTIESPHLMKDCGEFDPPRADFVT